MLFISESLYDAGRRAAKNIESGELISEDEYQRLMEVDPGRVCAVPRNWA